MTNPNERFWVEPIFHSNVTDVLPENHPWAYENVNCKDCGNIVHCCNNECMETWLEYAGHAFCIECFITKHTKENGAIFEGFDPDKPKDDAVVTANR